MTDTRRMAKCYGRKPHDCGMLATEGESPRIVIACTVCGMVRIVDVEALAQGQPLDDMDAAAILRAARTRK